MNKQGCARPVNIVPPGPITGYANPHCYLGNTRNCCHTRSEEHYVSAAVLSKVDRLIRVSGVPWLGQGETRDLPIPALKAGILCKRHNEAFSRLDLQASKFVEAILRFSDASYNKQTRVATFNGRDIERWMIKTLYGLLASKSLQASVGQRINSKITTQCIDLLYDRLPLEHGRGLFVRAHPNYSVLAIRQIQVTPVIKPSNSSLSGLRFNIGGFDFLLSTCPINVEGGVFRPYELIFDNNTSSKVIELIWTEEQYNQVVVWKVNHSEMPPKEPD